MSVREKEAVELFAKGYNCAQAVIGVFCQGSELDKNTALKLANGFGGGMRCGEVCGVVSGAVMAVGLKCGFYTEGDLAQKNYCNQKTYEFIERFTQENGSVTCRDLLGVDIRGPGGLETPEAKQAREAICPRLVASAVRIVEGMDFTIN